MDIWQTLVLLFQTIGTLIVQVASLGLPWLLWIIWAAWWLLAVNAYKIRHALALGAWAPLVLIILVAAIVWSSIDPSSDPFFGKLPNFWWQLLYVSFLAGLALFCGWLQTVLHWTPPDVHFDPPAHSHGHGHGHGHDQGHASAPAHH